MRRLDPEYLWHVNGNVLLSLIMTTRVHVIAVAALFLLPSLAHAEIPVVQDITRFSLEELFSVDNGSIERIRIRGKDALRWSVANGQTSRLSIKHDHPIYDQLRYYDHLQLTYRIASGEIHSIFLDAVGHVTGPRQYKVHNFRIAIGTTERKVWHHEELDLARPYWFPWDKPDGEGEAGYFRFEAMAIADDTEIEFTGMKLLRGLIYLKPDYEPPITWPVATNNADGSVSYQQPLNVLNTSGRPTEITARIVSKHKRFRVALSTNGISIKASKVACFKLKATISRKDIARTDELYSEPVRVVFSPSHRPEITTWWNGRFVRPLSQGYKRQVIISDADLAFLRKGIADKDANIKKLVQYDRVVAAANEFVGKVLQTVPQSYGHVRNSYPRPWLPGKIMSEAVNSKTGERRIGDHVAGAVWREYLGYSGRATYKTGLAYALTRDEKYAKKAIELMRLYASQYAHHKWHNLFDPPYFRGEPIQSSSRLASNSSYGSNWDFKWFCEMASLIADSPSWTDKDRTLIYLGFVLPYATELTKLNAQISNQTDITNHNLLLLGLAFNDPHLVYIATMRDCGLISRLQDIDEDGFSSEGRPLNYHGGAANEYLPSISHLANSGLNVKYGKKRLIAAVRMPYHRAALNGVVPNVGDCGRGQGVGPSRMADLLVATAPEEEWLLEIGRGSSLAAKLRRLQSGKEYDRKGWRKFLDSKPHVFKNAGLAILRSGNTTGDQVMVTLDYGRNIFHGAQDRNQITLMAFGKVFTHGPGSLYNSGRGGIKYNTDKRLKSFHNGRVSLANNVVVVDKISQLTCAGKLIAWSTKPHFQVAASRLAGIQPGVTHTRAVVLTEGIILVFDRIESKEEHEYDLVYHNFGDFALGKAWKAKSCPPLAKTGNYENIVDPKKLTGEGPLEASWNLTRQYAHWRKDLEIDESKLPAIGLRFWQMADQASTLHTGVTGLNNTNTKIISDEAPTVIHTVRARNVNFVTVLEPHKASSRIKSIEIRKKNLLAVTLVDGKTIETSLDKVLKRYRL